MAKREKPVPSERDRREWWRLKNKYGARELNHYRPKPGKRGRPRVDHFKNLSVEASAYKEVYLVRFRREGDSSNYVCLVHPKRRYRHNKRITVLTPHQAFREFVEILEKTGSIGHSKAAAIGKLDAEFRKGVRALKSVR
jgi:hypothetical protein